MAKKEKLIASVLNNPKAVRFDDACNIALVVDSSIMAVKDRIAFLSVMVNPCN